MVGESGMVIFSLLSSAPRPRQGQVSQPVWPSSSLTNPRALARSPPEPLRACVLTFWSGPAGLWERGPSLWLCVGFDGQGWYCPEQWRLGLEGLVLEAAAKPWGPGPDCPLHPAFAEGNWGPEERFSLQVAAAASGTPAAMASCPDSDNSWVLASSEVGRARLGAHGREVLAGLGCSLGLCPSWVPTVTCVTSFWLPGEGTPGPGGQRWGPRSQVVGLGLGLERRVPWGQLQEVGAGVSRGPGATTGKPFWGRQALHGVRWRYGLDCAGMKQGAEPGNLYRPRHTGVFLRGGSWKGFGSEGLGRSLPWTEPPRPVGEVKKGPF